MKTIKVYRIRQEIGTPFESTTYCVKVGAGKHFTRYYGETIELALGRALWGSREELEIRVEIENMQTKQQARALDL